MVRLQLASVSSFASPGAWQLRGDAPGARRGLWLGVNGHQSLSASQGKARLSVWPRAGATLSDGGAWSPESLKAAISPTLVFPCNIRGAGVLALYFYFLTGNEPTRERF